VGELRFWSGNGDYAYASDGIFTPADGSDRTIWKDVMPSRWAVRRLMQLAEHTRWRGAARREPQAPAGEALPAHTCKFQVMPEGCGGYYLRCSCGIVKSPDELSAGEGAPADYCATDGTCSCRKFAADPTNCERRKELASGVAPVEAPSITDEELTRRFTRCAYPGPNPMYRCNGCGAEEFGVRNLLMEHALACGVGGSDECKS
jgi:hypothetical protein